MDKKYIIVVFRRGRKRAVTIRKPSVEAARKHLEQVMRAHNWQDGELYENNCLTPAMEDGYVIDSTVHMKLNRELTWKIYKYKPV